MAHPEFSTVPSNPEQARRLAETSLIVQNFDRLTPEIVAADGDRAIAEAEKYLLIASGDVPADGDVTGDEQQFSPLEAISLAFNTLGLEQDNEAGIVPYLMRDVGPQHIREAAGEQQKRLQDFSNNVFVYGKYEPVFTALREMNTSAFDEEDQSRHGYYVKRFEKARQNPSDNTAEGADSLSQTLSAKSREFGKNTQKTATINLTPQEFDSLPENTRNQLNTDPGNALSVTLSEPNLNYILQNGPRELRKRTHETYYGERVAANDQLIQEMVGLRLQIAKSEGKSSWLARQSEGSITGGAEEVLAFYDKFKARVIPQYQVAIAKLQALFEADGLTGPMQEYDTPYYEKKFMESCYDVNEITFTLDRTVRGLFDFAEELYGIKVNETPEAKVWAKGVKSYTVHNKNSGEYIGRLYTDLAARKDEDGTGGKQDGGVTYALSYGLTKTNANGEAEMVQLPTAVSVTNVAPPAADGTEPKLTLRDIETVFHEIFGHALPILFARGRGVESSGDRVDPRIREINSQMGEHLPRDPNILIKFIDEGASEEAKRGFVENLGAVQEVREALINMRWLRIMKADLDLHGSQPNLAGALKRSAALMAPVGTDSHWIRALPHVGNSYAGNYVVYPYCDDKGGKMAGWFRRNNYSPLLGRAHKAILELGGRPGANEQLLAFTGAAADNLTIASIGGTASVASTSTVIS
ncbi:MAG TPA: M3 family metallopeptidase [Candidatus Saccharimonadales bacterium]|nr:M3 family metallopeptidase [Candidatus Saccharimonadales bacterium]